MIERNTVGGGGANVAGSGGSKRKMMGLGRRVNESPAT